MVWGNDLGTNTYIQSIYLCTSVSTHPVFGCSVRSARYAYHPLLWKKTGGNKISGKVKGAINVGIVPSFRKKEKYIKVSSKKLICIYVGTLHCCRTIFLLNCFIFMRWLWWRWWRRWYRRHKWWQRYLCVIDLVDGYEKMFFLQYSCVESYYQCLSVCEEVDFMRKVFISFQGSSNSFNKSKMIIIVSDEWL